MERYPSAQSTPYAVAEENARFMSKVYRWMTGGVALSGFIAWRLSQDPEMMMTLIGTRGLFMGLVFAQLAVVLGLSFFLRRLSSGVATLLYLAYSALTGVTFSVLFMTYTQESIVQVFGVTAFAFAGLSAFGYFTKKDLRAVGSFCVMGLFGMLGFSLLSWFFPSMMSGTNSKVFSIIGLIVFSGLTAWDTQKIKAMNAPGEEGQKRAIFGALILYLDFINLFLSLLQLTGRRR